MKLAEIAKAYIALNALTEEKLPLRISWGIDKIMRKIDRSFGFYVNKETELLKKYNPVKQNGMQVTFKDAETAEKYRAEHTELDEIEEEIQITPMRIGIETDLHISRESLRLLTDAGFIQIIDEEAEENGRDDHAE